MPSNKLYIDLNNLDITIKKLEKIRDLLNEIKDLQDDCDFQRTPPIRPEPMPYVPRPGTSPLTDVPWHRPEIWC